VGISNFPLTSVRRALTNLSKQGKLIKTDEKKKGIYGRDEFIWSTI
jgi:DNA-binding transcriptional regulator PaaX